MVPHSVEIGTAKSLTEGRHGIVVIEHQAQRESRTADFRKLANTGKILAPDSRRSLDLDADQPAILILYDNRGYMNGLKCSETTAAN